MWCFASALSFSESSSYVLPCNTGITCRFWGHVRIAKDDESRCHLIVAPSRLQYALDHFRHLEWKFGHWSGQLTTGYINKRRLTVNSSNLISLTAIRELLRKTGGETSRRGMRQKSRKRDAAVRAPATEITRNGLVPLMHFFKAPSRLRWKTRLGTKPIRLNIAQLVVEISWRTGLIQLLALVKMVYPQVAQTMDGLPVIFSSSLQDGWFT